MWKRCRDNGYRALVLTVDTTVQGKREADVKNSMHLPAHLRLENLEKYKKTADTK
jgi:isopentenyl diphosphate isomerase/L-lactate dehydrogenase-like FMN-dependent dehydrogenase